MEIEVEPFNPQRVDWQVDLKECLYSLIPSQTVQQFNRKPVLMTAILDGWNHTKTVRMTVTTTEVDDAVADDLIKQLQTTLAAGKVRCNETLEMYLPDWNGRPGARTNDQRWLLAAVGIIAFFVIIFSALLILHYKRRQVVTHKPRPQTHRQFLPQSSPTISVIMEPQIQHNPIYQKNRPFPTSKSPPKIQSEPPDDITAETFHYPPPLNPTRTPRKHLPELSLSSRENLPGFTEECQPNLNRMLEPSSGDEKSSQKSASSLSSEFSGEYGSSEIDSGEIRELPYQATARPESYAALMEEYRNGRPMTVRAVKQKNQFKKQFVKIDNQKVRK